MRLPKETIESMLEDLDSDECRRDLRAVVQLVLESADLNPEANPSAFIGRIAQGLKKHPAELAQAFELQSREFAAVAVRGWLLMRDVARIVRQSQCD